MPKGSKELTSARKDEIINACAALYETMSFREITLKPLPAAGVDFVRASYRIPAGMLKVDWQRVDGTFRLYAELPSGITGKAFLPDGTIRPLTDGANSFEC